MTICKMTKYFLLYKIQQETIYCIISYNTLHKTNDFSIVKAEAILLLVELISKKRSLFIDAPDKRDPVCIDEEILDRTEVVKMLEVKHINFKSQHTTFTRSRSGIQSIQNRFKLIEFDNSIRGQVSEPINKKNTITYMADILIDQDNYYLPLKTNIEYT